VLGLLHGICKEDGITCVLSLHQLDLARVHAERIVGLNRGRVVFDGTVAALSPQIIADIYHAPAGATARPSPGDNPAQACLASTGD
jgi:phosphonate transport system ATP-binding protein